MSTLHLSPSLPAGLFADPAALSPAGRPAALPRLGRLAAIAGAHGLLAWALLQSQGVRQALHEAQPLMVALLADVRPAPPEPVLPVPAKALPAPACLPPPEITVALAAAPAPPPAPVVVVPQPALQAQPAAAAATVAAPPPRLPAPAPVLAPAEPPPVGAGAIRYRLPPAIEVPMASRRLGEAGAVLLRVVVDVKGLPRQISLHRSSGFARLDQQALAAMRSARFQPLVEGGSAYEWLVIAPLQYDIDWCVRASDLPTKTGKAWPSWGQAASPHEPPLFIPPRSLDDVPQPLVPQGACRTWGTPAAIWPQRSIFHRLFVP